MKEFDYWGECISEAFEDAGIKATDDQINIVAGWAESAHDNFSMAFGYDCIPNPLVEENEKLQAEIKREREKVICDECGGKGIIVSYGPYHGSESGCMKCGGDGRHSL